MTDMETCRYCSKWGPCPDHRSTPLSSPPQAAGPQPEQARKALIDELREVAEDDVRAMRREVSMRRDQFVDEHDLNNWAGLMERAADALESSALPPQPSTPSQET